MVFAVVKHIKVDKNPSLNLDPWSLWEAWEEIADALVEIFASFIATNDALEDGRLPNVVSLFKEGSQDKPG